MKKAFKLCSVAFLLTSMTANVNAQSVTTVVGAKVVEAITLTETSPMHFGTMTVPSTPATVVLDAAGTATTTGTISLLSQAPFATAAAYTVTGSPDATYSITLPTSIILSNGVPANNMTVNTFTCSYTGLVGTVSFSGTDFFSLGATLNLANGQSTGNYAGTFDVSVAYN